MTVPLVLPRGLQQQLCPLQARWAKSGEDYKGLRKTTPGMGMKLQTGPRYQQGRPGFNLKQAVPLSRA